MGLAQRYGGRVGIGRLGMGRVYFRQSPFVKEVAVLSLPSERRIILRPRKISDLARCTDFIVHADSTKYMLIPEDTVDGAAEMLKMLIESYESESPFYSLSVADSRSDSFLGFCQLWPTSEWAVLEMVYVVLPTEHGRAIVTSAARALAQHVLGDENVRRIVAFVSPQNVPSVRVAEKAGLVCEGPAVHHGRDALKFSIGSPTRASVGVRFAKRRLLPGPGLPRGIALRAPSSKQSPGRRNNKRRESEE
jgi:RimJ/RimL family protein N-acetyltransferase